VEAELAWQEIGKDPVKCTLLIAHALEPDERLLPSLQPFGRVKLHAYSRQTLLTSEVEPVLHITKPH
jgi:hypothetical protein